MICINCFLSNVYLDEYVTVDPNNDNLKELLTWYIFIAGSLRHVSWDENSTIDAIAYMSVFKRKDMSAVSNVSFAYIINKRKNKSHYILHFNMYIAFDESLFGHVFTFMYLLMYSLKSLIDLLIYIKLKEWFLKRYQIVVNKKSDNLFYSLNITYHLLHEYTYIYMSAWTHVFARYKYLSQTKHNEYISKWSGFNSTCWHVCCATIKLKK